jgi:glyoxylase-like metal-dependent hydrolase (beta-lactamase superfamily II)
VDKIAIDLGGIACHAVHVGGDHASDSTIFYIPDEKIMFLGDALYQRLYAPKPHYTAMKVFSLVASLLAYDVNWYLWGHDPTPMSRMEFLAFTDRLEKIGEAVMMSGNDRERILMALAEEGMTDLDEEDMELVAFFEAGL